jgi:hypothetical protein
MGDIVSTWAFFGYLVAAPALGAMVSHFLARGRMVRRLADAHERAAFLRTIAEDYATRLAGYQQRETRITLPSISVESRHSPMQRAGRR